jgi:E3 ubiquitin-protein ligase BRE1
VQAKVDGEHWVMSTRTYQQVVQELQAVNEAMASKGRELEAVCKERDEAVREVQVKNHYFHVSLCMP